MVDIDIGRMREGFWNYFPLAALVGVLIALQMAAVLLHGFWDPAAQAPDLAANIGGTKELGLLIYTEYIYAFEIAAVILLLAIVAAVALTLRKRKDSKHFDPAMAVKVKRNDRIRMVSMKAESERANGVAATTAPAAEKQ
jgi:NADH-quinone oxidoreductase subunit J